MATATWMHSWPTTVAATKCGKKGLVQADPDVTLTVDETSIAEAGGEATVTISLAAASLLPVSVDLSFTGTATQGDDFAVSRTSLIIDAGVTSATITVTALQDELDEPDETVTVMVAINGAEVGTQQQTIAIVDDDFLEVTSLTATASGFVADFSNQLDASSLNLYDTVSGGWGAADVTLEGGSVGTITGSLVLSADGRSLTFMKTGAPLAADLYLVNIRSAADGLIDVDGQHLDGNGDGTPGDGFQTTFRVDPPAADSVVVSLPDFARGPGQAINLPADAALGIPINISETNGVRSVELQINYDPSMLQITEATPAAGTPVGSTASIDTDSPGLATVTFTSPTPLPEGAGSLVSLQALVPAGATVGGQHVLDVHSVTIIDGNGSQLSAIADDAVHLVGYLADVTGNGRINASDAARVARVAALLDSGFEASILTDPMLLGDVSGNGRINAGDASLIARFAALLPVPEIPLLPTAQLVAAGAPTIVDTDATPDRHDVTVGLPSEASVDEYWGNAAVPNPAIDVDVPRDDRRMSSEENGNAVLEDAIDELFAELEEMKRGDRLFSG